MPEPEKIGIAILVEGRFRCPFRKRGEEWHYVYGWGLVDKTANAEDINLADCEGTTARLEERGGIMQCKVCGGKIVLIKP